MGVRYEGRVFNSRNYGEFTVTHYENCYKVHIEFPSGWCDVVTAGAVRKGLVKDYLKPETCGIGFNSLGRLKGKSNNKKLVRARNLWDKMIERCYGEGKLKDNPTYKGCTVHEDWHDFANYWEWYDRVCDSPVKSTFHVDKDLCCKGNKMYSEDTCFLVPRKINNLISTFYRVKGDDLPVGVHLHKGNGRFQAYYNDFKGKRHSLKFHDTAKEAFAVYKPKKEAVIREVAEFYKDVIDERLYNILMNYELNFEGR